MTQVAEAADYLSWTQDWLIEEGPTHLPRHLPAKWMQYFNNVVGRTLREEQARATGDTKFEFQSDPTGRKVIELPRFLPSDSPKYATFAALAEWQGVVTSIRDGSFEASLVRLSEKTEEEFAEIPLEELTDFERQNLCEGSRFRWAIGYARLPSGQKLRSSSIYFLRYSPAAEISARSSTLDTLFAGSVE
ncbi:MAG: hypothetical protein KF779_09730 [Hyphomonadaceae bacterium]|nr:hypothetical protein [Hyphomonadaceae bacterium]